MINGVKCFLQINKDPIVLSSLSIAEVTFSTNSVNASEATLPVSQYVMIFNE